MAPRGPRRRRGAGLPILPRPAPIRSAPLSTDPTAQGHVTTTVTDGIATVRFGHPKSNSLPGALLARLADAITAAGQDPAARAIVLASDGPGAFCAGASFDELRAVADADGGRRFFSGFARVILAMVRAPRFVIARVHGKTAGGGVGLAAASDYAIATRGAAARLSELAVGIGPFVVGPPIERKIGAGAYAAMSVDAAWRPADWALRHGLYAEVVDDVAALDEAVAARARWAADANPEAVRELKRVFWAGTDHWDQLLAERAAISGRLVLTAPAQDAIARAGRG
jgi:methylglutaconyl-CoA hydratase